MMPLVIDNVVGKQTINELYNYLISSSNWHLNRSTKDGTIINTFPGMVVYDDTTQQVSDLFIYGYINALVDVMRTKHEIIPPVIKRIHLGATTETSETVFHPDMHDATCMTMLGFIMPEWSPEWGGEFYLEDQAFPCDPGKFVIFPSTMYHKGESPNQKTPYWRVSLNIICGMQ